jgi:hypothetical protein
MWNEGKYVSSYFIEVYQIILYEIIWNTSYFIDINNIIIVTCLWLRD